MTYDWSLITLPSGSNATLNNPTAAQPDFTPDFTGNYIGQLIVNDGLLNSNPDNVNIQVDPLNVPPMAKAGIDQLAVTGQQVNLDGSSSFDPDGGALAFNWVLMKPNSSTASLDNTAAVQPLFTPDIAGTYTGQLIVVDASGLNSMPDTVDVTVTANVSPVINSLAITTATVGQNYSYDVNASDADGHSLIYSLGTFPTGMTIDVNSGIIIWTPNTAGDFSVMVNVTDSFGGQISQSFSINVQGNNSGLPPDPATVAPPLDQTVATNTFDATQFLYTGSNPIQTSVAPTTIETKRAAVIRGKVMDKQNNPLSGVTITIHNHPEFGQTLSRADGMFDMVVNGGGILNVNYQKAGLLPTHRQVDVPWRDYVIAPDAILISLDPQITNIDLTSNVPFQVATGSVVTDSDGTRQARLLIPQGTTAQMVMSDGSLQGIDNLSIRMTEYTVGNNGPETMPAPLPANTAYTYAVEFSVDEAIASGAKEVNFNQPVYSYINNFLNLPAGVVVPAGYYDRQKAKWIPEDDGLVVTIIGVSGLLADVDIDGDGVAGNGPVSTALGFTDAEREELAQLYPVGTSLWRVPIQHFSPHDFNYIRRLATGAVPPATERPKGGTEDTITDPNCEQGSIVECENQTLGENLPLTGTPFSLSYRSDRFKGRKTNNSLKIDLLNGNFVPTGLQKIELEIQISGRKIIQTFVPPLSSSYNFEWDGLDVYGRKVLGAQTAKIRIGYVYSAFYLFSNSDQQAILNNIIRQSFGSIARATGTAQRIIRGSGVGTLWQEHQVQLGTPPNSGNIGGWNLSVNHHYDPLNKILYLGNGNRRNTEALDVSATGAVTPEGQIITFAGKLGGLIIDDVPATQSRLAFATDVAIAPDGNVFIADSSDHRIRKISPNGIITTVAGDGNSGFSGDGGLAIAASIGSPTGIAAGSDGSLYIATGLDADDFDNNNRIRKVSTNGIINTVAGAGVSGFSGDGGFAADATLHSPADIVIGNDGSLYIAETNNSIIRKVSTDGTITTVAGNGNFGFSGDGGLATNASLGNPKDIAIGSDGSIYIADRFRIRKVSSDGIITTVAGNGVFGFSGDGGPATQANIGNVDGITVDSENNFFITDQARIRKVSNDGVITTVAGSGNNDLGGFQEGSAKQIDLDNWIGGIEFDAKGNLFIADGIRVALLSHNFFITGFVIPSEDGSMLYQFSQTGRHLQTINALTNSLIYQFSYANGELISITDGDGNITTIERDTQANPTTIVAPFGQRTNLTLNGDGFLATVTNLENETYEMTYTTDGLLTAFKDPRLNSSIFTYDSLGRLIMDANADNGSLTLTRTELAGGYRVETATALGRITGHEIHNLSTGDQDRILTRPDGTVRTNLKKTDGTTITTDADGTVTTTVDGPDPRFSMLSPLPKSTTITTGGLTSTVALDRSVNLSDPANPLSLISITDQLVINGRTSSSIFDTATRTFTDTSAAGRQSISMIDTLGRVTQVQNGGLLSVLNSYDTNGRLSTNSIGTGASERLAAFSYSPAGFLSTITDPLLRAISFEYDLAGKITKQTLPDSREILYGYDTNGNLTSLTPPGRPAHVFQYTAINQTKEYIPPDIGIGPTNTVYQYNLDKQLNNVSRPDNQSITFAYDATSGKLTKQTTPLGDTLYGYDATTGKLTSIDTPDGQKLDYNFNGALLGMSGLAMIMIFGLPRSASMVLMPSLTITIMTVC